MEDKRTAFAILLSTILVVVYSQIVFAPYEHPKNSALPPSSSNTAEVSRQPSSVANPSVLSANSPQPAGTTVSTHPSPEEIDHEGVLQLETDTARFGITLLGGRLQKFELKDYRLRLSEDAPMNLVSSAPGAPLPLGLVWSAGSDERVAYKLTAVSGAQKLSESMYQLTDSPEAQIELTGSWNGISIKKKIRIVPHSYLFQVEVEGDPAQSAWLEWSEVASDAAINDRLDPKMLTILTADQKIENTMLKDIPTTGSLPPIESRWAGFTDKYFMGTIFLPSAASVTQIGREGNSFFYRINGNNSHPTFSVYAGPKDIEILRSMGSSLERSVDLGFFSFLAHPLVSAIRFLYHVLGNYGLAIIALTLLIKLLFFPLTRASFKSMQAMQELQPEIKELRERIKDATQLNQEMMALYKRRGVNPVGGCFPILIQIPVFFGLYSALLHSIELRHAPYALWITDLSAPENLHLFGIHVPLMIIIMGLSMLVQQWTQPSTMDPQQKKIMMMMPFIFMIMFIIYPMPSGLVIYWLVNNIISITQQIFLRSAKGGNPLTATLVASVAIFVFGYVLTLI